MDSLLKSVIINVVFYKHTYFWKKIPFYEIVFIKCREKKRGSDIYTSLVFQ